MSRTVKDLVAGSGLSFADRGMHALGADGQRWRVFAAQVQAHSWGASGAGPSGGVPRNVR